MTKYPIYLTEDQIDTIRLALKETYELYLDHYKEEQKIYNDKLIYPDGQTPNPELAKYWLNEANEAKSIMRLFEEYQKKLFNY